jgi:hypothetical protein
MKWTGLAAIIRKRNACNIAAWKPEEKRSFWKPRLGWKDNIKMDVRKYRCPKSLEPMGILFVIYIICSVCSPRHSTHFLSRFTMFVWILLNTLGSTVAQQSVIVCIRWRRSRILTACTCAFRNPYEALSPPFHPMLMPFLAF